MSGPTPRTILVALEDGATASVVAAAAAHIAMAQDATALILLHVVDTHMVAGGLLGLSGVMGPVGETGEDQEALLACAEAAIRAEFIALERPVPAITRRVSAGAPAAVIAQVAKDAGGHDGTSPTRSTRRRRPSPTETTYHGRAAGDKDQERNPRPCMPRSSCRA